MNRISALVIASLLMGASIGAAGAADVLPPAPKLDDDGDGVLAPNSGWYLRGDVGLDAYNGARFKLARNPLNNAGSGATFHDHDRSAQQSFIGGLGVGYQYNDWLRFDVTGEMHGSAKVSNTYALFDPSGQALGRSNAALLSATHSAKLSSDVGLANTYIDLLTWHGVTPYVGAGLGVANVHLANLSDRGTLVGADGLATPVGIDAPGATKTNFAWALMTGISYDVTPNMKLDLGYRYLNIGSPPAGRSANGLFKVSSATLGEQEIRLGLRWMFNGNGK